MSALAKASGALKSVDYEVFGRVQGVCFRMYTEEEARKLGVVGWVKNTSQGTVTGQVQGPEDKVNAIKKSSCLKASGHRNPCTLLPSQLFWLYYSLTANKFPL
ncbi:acylphosphatase-2 isoform X2 [Phalacrocorax aristotelis]|uniref:acylphosphatase-2 isoform X2 n=1 Tax=Phalacrocorax aristotelis TaxID=126867 RepID=UPI003F4C877C